MTATIFIFSLFTLHPDHCHPSNPSSHSPSHSLHVLFSSRRVETSFGYPLILTNQVSAELDTFSPRQREIQHAQMIDFRSYSFLPSLSLQSSAQAVSGRKTNCDTDHTIHLGHCSSSPGSICADMKHRGWECLLPCCWHLGSP